jgi:hypothetical protein
MTVVAQEEKEQSIETEQSIEVEEGIGDMEL